MAPDSFLIILAATSSTQTQRDKFNLSQQHQSTRSDEPGLPFPNHVVTTQAEAVATSLCR